MRIALVARQAAARCAFCHDDLDGSPRPCATCATVLHDDCWELVRRCPTLGCERRLRVVIAAAFRGATSFHLVLWLIAFAAVWASLFYAVPQFDRMFRETGVQLPEITEAVLALSSFCRSPLGIVVSVVVVLGSLQAFRRARGRAEVRLAFVAGTLIAVAFFPVALVGLFLPLCQSCVLQKL